MCCLRRLGLGALALAVTVPAIACGGGGTATDAAAADAAARLGAIADEVWERSLERDLTVRLVQGLPIESLPDLSYEAAKRDADLARGVLEQLGEIDPEVLEHDDWLTYAVIERNAKMTVEALQYYWLTNLFTPYSSPLGLLPQLLGGMPIRDMQEAWNYLTVMRQVPVMLEQLETLARGGMERGFVVSAANMSAVIGLVRSTILPHDSGPFAVSLDRMEQLDSLQQGQVRQEIQGVVDVLINPALEKFAEFLETEYAPAAPEGVGLAQYPGGDEYYRYLVRAHTTMEIEPSAVQAIGYEMIGRMQERMAAIQADLGFAGDTAGFREYLRTDPELYPESPDEVGERLMSAASAFYARVDEFFPHEPQALFGARRLAPALEGSQTYGYYSPPTAIDPVGYYNYNGSNLDQRSWINLKGLAYHELFPGHHFQIALQKENAALHPLRQSALVTAYTEGWGSYSSLLGLELGMLEDPLSQYGLYTLEIFLATRLVVDPGMNSMGMSLQEARQLMRETTFESETQIGTESLRYSTDMPGQALGYQMGKRRLLELRDRVEAALGERFDLREFHGAILGPGPLPMTVLEAHVDWFIHQKLEAGN